MSRLKKFSRNLAASYLQLGANVVYSLISIPLILHWLPRPEFGIWAVLLQLMGYVSIIDLGMTAAVARLLVDHKDERANGNYGSLIKTAFVVSSAQGLIIFMATLLAAPLVAHLMKIPAEYQDVFILLMRVQGAVAALTFVLRPLGLMLDAHQRMDVVAYYNVFNLAMQLGLLVAFLAKGWGIYSFLFASVISALISPVYLAWNCRRLKVLPNAGEWGSLSWQKFHEVFSFGMDVFLFNLGGQLIMSSQTIIVTRCLGLDVAAVWSVGTRVFYLCLQLVLRPLYMSMPALAEMIVRNEMTRLRYRFQGLLILTGSLGVYAGISCALCNSLFVKLWTHNHISWAPANDVLLAAWMAVLSLQAVHCNFCLVTKRIAAMRYIFFLEGCCFVLLAGRMASSWGVRGIVTISVLCTFLFSFQYGVRRSMKFFQLDGFKDMAAWIAPALRLFFVLGLVAILTWFLAARLPSVPRLCINAFVVLVPGSMLFLRFGCPPQTLHELSTKLPPIATKWLLLFTAPV